MNFIFFVNNSLKLIKLYDWNLRTIHKKINGFFATLNIILGTPTPEQTHYFFFVFKKKKKQCELQSTLPVYLRGLIKKMYSLVGFKLGSPFLREILSALVGCDTLSDQAV